MEIWKDIEGYEGYYQVNNAGIIKSLARTVDHKYYGKMNLKEKTRKQTIDKYGYMQLPLSKEGKLKMKFVHRIVAIAFIPNNDNKQCINHIDGNKENNKISNLEWCTHGENNKHAYDNGLRGI